MTRELRLQLGPRSHQRGAGALIVVMVLFFVISLVAAYTNRNIIFEQKTSANQYRSTQAFEAAEAGVAWGLAMLNAGNIDGNCLPSATGTSFRSRYLSINSSTGAILPIQWPDANAGPNQYNVECVLTATGWSCNCPTNSAPTLTPPPTAPAPAFVLQISNANNGPGFFTLISQGCTSLYTNCTIGGLPPSGDATAQINAVVALKGAIATPPAAALTTATSALATPGSVDFSAGGSLQVSNSEAQTNGTTIDAAGAVDYPTNMTLTSLPGTPGTNSYAQADGSLPVPFTDLPASANDSLFVQVFGMARATYQQQPTTIVLNCSVGDCTATNLAAAAARNPGRTLWLAGGAALAPTSAMTIGSSNAPVVVVSDGNLTVSGSPLTINGLLYVYNDNTGSTGVWTTGGSLSVIGATVVEGNIVGPGTLALSYSNAINPVTLTSPGILNQLRVATGSFVRVPGGWLDYPFPPP